MDIILKTLNIKNFKGIKDLTVNFNKTTSILGANASGKTTIFDAYSWLLWDKDSLNRKDFDIKPFNKNGENIHGVESTVSGVLEVDGKEFKLTKIYKEVWTKKRGQLQETFTGHTTDYYINAVPVKKAEYNERIEALIPEKEFNLLSNPMYFNQILDKKEKRAILLSLIKDVDKTQIIAKNKDLEKLDLDNYSIDELKAMAKASAKKINEEIASLPVRIDELEASKNTYNFESIELNKKEIEKKIEEVRELLSKGSSLSEIILEKNKEIQGLIDAQRELKRATDDLNDKRRREIERLYNEEKGAFEETKKEARNKLEEASNSYYQKEKKIKTLETEIEALDKEVQELRTRYIETNKKVFDGSLKCPTCGRPYEEYKQTEIKEMFNLNKSKELEVLSKKGKELASKLEEKKAEISGAQFELEISKKKLNRISLEFECIGEFKKEKPVFVEELVPQEYVKLQEKIDGIKKELEGYTDNNNEALFNEEKRLRDELESIIKILALKDQNRFIDERIEKYKAREKELAALYEGQQETLYLCDEYIKIYTDSVQDQINDLFENISFRLFEKQVNGEIKETAEATVNGVPYSSVNNAGKINAGLDVINTLSKHLGISVPVFVDNAESVNELINVNGQLVKLIVSKDKNLIIK